MRSTKSALGIALVILTMLPPFPGTSYASPDLEGEHGAGAPVHRSTPVEAPEWASGSYWTYTTDEELLYCATLESATLVVTHISGALTETLAGKELLGSTFVYRLEGSLAQTIRGNLTVYIGGFPVTTPVTWPLVGNTTELLRVADLATLYTFSHLVVDMGTLGSLQVDTSSSFSPPLESYKFPLSPGLSWRLSSTVSAWTRTSGSMGAFEYNTTTVIEAMATVAGEETVPTPVGALRCLNITHRGTSTTPGGSPEPYNRTILYSPGAEKEAIKTSGLGWAPVALALSDFKVNHAPRVVSPPTPVSFPEDTVDTSLNLAGIFSDPDNGDELRFSASGLANISAQVDARTGAVRLVPPQNWSGSETARFRAQDSRGAACETSLQITVTPVNDPPFVSAPLGAVVMDEDTVDETLNLTPHFSDPDLLYGDGLNFSFRNNGSVAVQVHANGTVLLSPLTNWSGFVNITFVATDLEGEKAEGILELAVRNTPDAPVCTCATHRLEVPEDGALTLSLPERFFDADLPYGDRLVFSASSALPGMVLDIEPGRWELRVTPPSNFSGSAPLLFRATDSTNMSAEEEVELSVVPVNDPPVILASYPVERSVSLPENSTLEFHAVAMDADSPALQYLWFLDGAVVGEGPSFNLTPTFDSAGVHDLRIRVSDGELEAEADWRVTVLNVNRPPQNVRVLSPAEGARIQKGRKVVLRACATDPDGDALTFVWKESGRVLGTGELLELGGFKEGRHTLTVLVSDGNSTVDASVSFAVAPPPSSSSPAPGGPMLLLAALALLYAKRFFLERERREIEKIKFDVTDER
ncbi:MAG: tandem-95 repeat protein [Thermoplasmata archaeon]